jgi:hypothetical protein
MGSSGKAQVVLGLLPGGEQAEEAINSLTEQGFSERHISLVMRDEQTARAIIDDYGPLRGTDEATLQQRLSQLNVDSNHVSAFLEGIAQGKALLAVDATAADSAAIGQTFEDNQADSTVVV